MKKAQVELASLRWDPGASRLVLAKRLLVRLEFKGRESGEVSRGGSRGRQYRGKPSHKQRPVVAQIAVRDKGLYRVSFEEVFGSRRRGGYPADTLRLSYQGEAVAFHIEPNPDRFAPGSSLYFVSDGAVLNPHSLEAVYELEKGVPGPRMVEAWAAPSGTPVDFYWKRQEHEVNYYYQSSLLDVPDLWMWDFIFSFQEKSFFFDAAGLSPVNETAQLEIWLQGGSDLEGSPDHHVQVFLNDTPLDEAEAEWNGKEPKKLEAVLGRAPRKSRTD